MRYNAKQANTPTTTNDCCKTTTATATSIQVFVFAKMLPEKRSSPNQCQRSTNSYTHTHTTLATLAYIHAHRIDTRTHRIISIYIILLNVDTWISSQWEFFNELFAHYMSWSICIEHTSNRAHIFERFTVAVSARAASKRVLCLFQHSVPMCVLVYLALSFSPFSLFITHPPHLYTFILIHSLRSHKMLCV